MVGVTLALLATAIAGWKISSAEEPRAKEDPPELRRLMELADPQRDDWETESFQARANRALEFLAARLEEGGPRAGDLDGVAIAGAQSSVLRPSDGDRYRPAGGFEIFVWRGDPDQLRRLPLTRALAKLGAPLGRGGRQVSFKIVGVAADEGDRATTEVRYEARGQADSGRVQQTALWRVDWTWPADPELPRVTRLELLEFEEHRRDSLLLVDRTELVLGPQDVQLAHGGEYWHGRVDGLGEPNLMGHQGIALGDVNGDGFEDLYVATGTGLPNRLYVRVADGTATDTAEVAGVAWLDDTKGVLFADMDNDGDQDLLCAIGPTIVLGVNDGSGKFGGFVSMRAPTSAAFYSLTVADFDLDGDLDIYGARYVALEYGVSVPVPFHDARNGPSNHLMRNDGENRFTDVTPEAGLNVNNDRFSLIGAWGDYDDDGDPDLYVTNDFGRNNLYRNDGGIFVDVAEQLGVEDQAAGMGASWSDYDRDGDLDLYVTNMFSAAGRRVAFQSRFQEEVSDDGRRRIQQHALGNTLYANDGAGGFEDVSDVAGVRMGRWGWGARFVDLNNDGYDDIVVPNGFLTGPIEDDL